MKQELYPLVFQPVYKDHMWGGNRLAALYNRDLPGEVCAESWEIADRPEGTSVVTDGPLAGRCLNELVTQFGSDLTGTDAAPGPFPLLIKIIDARLRLSLQVHPNDRNAGDVCGEPKMEAWYFLPSDPRASIMVGLREGVTRTSFASAERNGTLHSLVNTLPVSAGDVIFVPGGRVHAIDAGCLLLEVQQNSNTTFRVSDWGRVDQEGRSRQLHQAEAMRVINWSDTSTGKQKPDPISQSDGGLFWSLCTTPCFKIEKWVVSTNLSIPNDGSSFHALFLESGHITVKTAGFSQTLLPGTTCLIPAAIKNYQLLAHDPVLENSIIKITL